MTREDAINVLSSFRVVGLRAGKGMLHKAICMAIDALWELEYRSTPPVLTIDELRDMVGEPVYIVKGDIGWWDIVWYFSSGGWMYTATNEYLRIESCGVEWRAYRHKPEVVEHGR